MKIVLAADHKGFELKEKIKVWLTEWNYEYEDTGAFKVNFDDNYPEFVAKAAEMVSRDPQNVMGIVLGLSGQGEAMAANKCKGVRAAVYYGGPEEIITLSREHNDANVLSLGASFLEDEVAKKMVKLWLDAKFSGEERHLRRIQEIADMENAR